MSSGVFAAPNVDSNIGAAATESGAASAVIARADSIELIRHVLSGIGAAITIQPHDVQLAKETGPWPLR